MSHESPHQISEETPMSRSSSASLSTPPRSPTPSAQLNDSVQSVVTNPAPSPAAPGYYPPGTAVTKDGRPRKKPGRKPAPVDPNAPPKPQRKPRKPKDPNAPVVKRKSKESLDSNATSSIMAVSGSHQGQPPPSFFSQPPPAQPTSEYASWNPSPANADKGSAPPPTTSNPFRSPNSGQNYDPIRSNYDPVRETVATQSHSHYMNPQAASPNPPPPPANKASASPSIASLVDPPNNSHTSPHLAAQSFFASQHRQTQPADNQNSLPPSPTANRPPPPVTMAEVAVIPPQPFANPVRPGPLSESFLNVQPQATAVVENKKKEPERKNSTGPVAIKKSLGNGSTAASSAAASPKPPKVKEPKEPKEPKDTFPAPPPLPGSGLMQLGGINGGANDGTEFRAPTVVLNIPMNGETNKYINFTRLAEERYGWDALHPRLAAQRDRLARVAAAGAALERSGSGKESGDDMSLDSEGEGSNVEMGGMSDGRNGTGTDGGKKKVPTKRKMKEDEYDKMDGFVDDSELLWEEQAAAANDGFFVYSGPLVPEGEKAVLERGDSTPKRARGRGRGGATRGSGAARGGSALTAERAVGRTGLPLTGPGSRGGNTSRKPRITKADRARMEQEKAEREKMGTLASMSNGYGSSGAANAVTMGNTPLVFNNA